MGSFSLSHWLVVLVVALILFGRGRLSETMGDFGRGIRQFRKGIREGEEDDPRAIPLPGNKLRPPAARSGGSRRSCAVRTRESGRRDAVAFRSNAIRCCSRGRSPRWALLSAPRKSLHSRCPAASGGSTRCV